MKGAGGDVGDSFPCERTEIDSDGRVRRVGGAVAELPEGVVAPAGGGAVR